MPRAAAAFALMFTLLAACDDSETRTFMLRHLEPEEAMQMVEPYVPDGASSMRVTRTEDRAAITITAPAARIEEVAELLARFDRSADVQLRFQVIEANGFTEVDPAIADVEGALQELFRFDGYRLAAEAVARARAPGFVEQRAAGDEGQQYRIMAELQRVVLDDDGNAAVELSINLASAEAPLLSTMLTVPSGQTVVVGSARALSSGNTVILVVRPVIE